MRRNATCINPHRFRRGLCRGVVVRRLDRSADRLTADTLALLRLLVVGGAVSLVPLGAAALGAAVIATLAGDAIDAALAPAHAQRAEPHQPHQSPQATADRSRIEAASMRE